MPPTWNTSFVRGKTSQLSMYTCIMERLLNNNLT